MKGVEADNLLPAITTVTTCPADNVKVICLNRNGALIIAPLPALHRTSVGIF